MPCQNTDATTLLESLAAGSTTAESLVLESIEKIKGSQASLNAATEILEESALIQLQALPDGPLKGLPFSIKECYALAGKEVRLGSRRMPAIQCAEDASVVQLLKAAGAVVVARGNTSEFLMGRETNNLVSGRTGSALNPALTSGGSSGGDGTMVGSGSVAFSIGTDIGGSCRYPAVFNGIVGFKPASGQIGKSG
jgi:Asp-tRNA(Asn)/Glu-tRNA(Gln) amidotransferase A subunit family amidase